jgi:hypothetical protein
MEKANANVMMVLEAASLGCPCCGRHPGHPSEIHGATAVDGGSWKASIHAGSPRMIEDFIEASGALFGARPTEAPRNVRDSTTHDPSRLTASW